jgi:hypothetical protein
VRTTLRSIEGEPWFILLDVDEAYHGAVRALGYRDVDGGFGSPCPGNSPHVRRAFANFERYAGAMIEQAAGARPVPWERTLLALLHRFDGHHHDWWLLGSAALAVRGLDVRPRDIDLVVADEAVSTVEELLLEYLVQPVVLTPGWVHNSFARAFLHSRVEWVGGVSPTADERYLSDQGPYAASRLEVVRWRGHELRVPPLALQLEVCKQRGLAERVRVIEAALGDTVSGGGS